MEILNSFLCHDCGSNCAISEVVYGKIKINLCNNCIKKKEEKTEFTFSELDEKAKSRAMYNFLSLTAINFDRAWDLLISDFKITYDKNGDI